MELADLLEQLSFLGLALLLVPALVASRIQLTGTLQQLLLLLTHLNRVDGVIGGDSLDRLAITVRLHGDSGLEFGTVGAALAHEWDPPLQGRCPASKVNDWACSENQSTSENAFRTKRHLRYSSIRPQSLLFIFSWFSFRSTKGSVSLLPQVCL